MGAAEAGDEMVLEHSDGAFGLVAAVGMWWYELVVNVVVGQEVLE